MYINRTTYSITPNSWTTNLLPKPAHLHRYPRLPTHHINPPNKQQPTINHKLNPHIMSPSNPQGSASSTPIKPTKPSDDSDGGSSGYEGDVDKQS
jgi:hypothetical protein